jgi:hypothetical protein
VGLGVSVILVTFFVYNYGGNLYGIFFGITPVVIPATIAELQQVGLDGGVNGLLQVCHSISLVGHPCSSMIIECATHVHISCVNLGMPSYAQVIALEDFINSVYYQGKICTIELAKSSINSTYALYLAE